MCLFLTLSFNFQLPLCTQLSSMTEMRKVFQNVVFEVVLFQLHSLYPLVITVGEALLNPSSLFGCCPLLSVLYVICIAYAVNFCFCFCYIGGCCIDCDWKGSIHKWSWFRECKSFLTRTIIKSKVVQRRKLYLSFTTIFIYFFFSD